MAQGDNSGFRDKSNSFKVKDIDIRVYSAINLGASVYEIDGDVDKISEKFNDYATKSALAGCPLKIKTFRPIHRLKAGDIIHFDNLIVTEDVNLGGNFGDREFRGRDPLRACDIEGTQACKDYNEAVMQRHFGNDEPLPCDNCRCDILIPKPSNS